MSQHKKRRVRPEVRIKSSWVVNDKYPAFDHKAIIYVLDIGGVEVRVLHWSGRYDGPVKILARHIAYLVRKYRIDAFTTTESQQPFARRRVQKALGKTWGVAQRGEYLHGVRLAMFKRMDKVSPVIHVLTKIAGYAGWRNLRVGVFIVRLKELGIPIAWLDFHGPADIQNGDDWGGSPKQIAIAKRGYPRMSRRADALEAKKPDAVIIFAGDKNFSARAEDVQEWFEDTLNATSIWSDGRMPKQGTHATSDRIIDDALIRHVVGKGNAGDHGTLRPLGDDR